MGHHGYEAPKDWNEESLKSAFKFIDKSPKTEFPRLKDLGATGEFPEGKLVENDEGEIRIGITSHEGKVIIDFGKPVTWVGFTTAQARLIANTLLKRVEDIDTPVEINPVAGYGQSGVATEAD